MNEVTRKVGEGPPEGRPPRRDLLLQMLEGTGRGFVPIRRDFLQKPRGTTGNRGASLAQLTRDSFALDSYLLIHALASSSAPHLAYYPVATWVQLARLDETATFSAGKSRWSKVVTKLVNLSLVERERKGNEMQYRLLHEAGSGDEYTRPKNTGDGNWFKLPYTYWIDDFDQQLLHPEKIMLLIALDQPDGFKLPLNQVDQWYGVSESTARRGLRGLEARGLLSVTRSHIPSPRSPSGWMQELRYTLRGAFSKRAIQTAQAKSKKKRHFVKVVDS